jgi:hypothetical protein
MHHLGRSAQALTRCTDAGTIRSAPTAVDPKIGARADGFGGTL